MQRTLSVFFASAKTPDRAARSLQPMQPHCPYTAKLSFYGLLLGTAVLLAGCQSPQQTEEVPPVPRVDQMMAQAAASGESAENMLDWAGTYQAILPCNGCAGVAISVQLRSNKTALVRERRLGEPHQGSITPTFQGNFRFSTENPSLIALIDPGYTLPAYHFFVGENWIEMRDRRTGAALTHTTTYRLQKTSTPN